MGVMVYSLLSEMQDLYHRPYVFRDERVCRVYGARVLETLSAVMLTLA